MTSRDDFTDEEWFRVRSAPWQAAMGVIEADPSGTLATGRELHAVENALQYVRDNGSDNDLIRLVAEDLAEDREDGPAAATTPVAEQAGVGEFPDRVLDAMRDLAPLLARTAPADAPGFAAWLVDLARAAALGAREGALGVTGPMVSDAEQVWLGRLQEVFGLDPGPG